ncbi:MAG TPA: hypothetical protein VFY73_10405 [Ideonella sp.]|uniref:hypothetical protein n=1 Tax=Ideonella sp. TaxID=1929293 RepID=UPI002E3368BF|nr:hypothetical protein [Ideonella sp.]HEX5684430.1 hypothetical protein [Ideonella sp.]
MLRSLIAAAMAALSTVAALAAPGYKIEVIPQTARVTPTVAFAINNSGVVVGQGETSDGQVISFKYSKGKVSRLAGDLNVWIRDINRAGDILGQVSDYNVIWHADGSREELSVGGLVALNRHLEAAGSAMSAGGDLTHATFYKNGTLTDLGSWGGNHRASLGRGINDLGQVVGVTYLENNSGSVAVIWENGTSRRVVGLADEQSSEGISINAKGHIVGYATTLTRGDGFINDGTPRRLPRVMSYPFMPKALNVRDEVVGTVAAEAGLSMKGKSYKLMSLLDASSAGWTVLDVAWDVNDSGQIVGTGIYHGARRAFVATPVTQAE